MVRRIGWKTLVIGCVGLLLVGCSSGHVASGLTSEQTVGTWTASDEFRAQLILLEDGTLEATDWPESVGCDRGDATDLEDLQGTEMRDFRGSWASYGGTLTYQLTLSFDNEVCPEGGTMAYVWRNSDDSLDLCIKISPDVSSDLVRRDQIFVLQREPVSGGETTDSCR